MGGLLSEPVTGRELLLAGGVGAMILVGLCSFLLAGRVAEKTHVALAMLIGLIGGFSLLGLLVALGHANAAAAIAVLAGLIGLFKLMNQFEITRKGPPGR